jgi:hemoglobin
MARIDERSLYRRIGGYENIVELAEGICGRMLRDGALAVYFKGHNAAGKKRLQSQFVSYIVNALGGPDIYCGLNLKSAHEGLGVTQSDWDSFLQLVDEAIQKYKVAKNEGAELLRLFDDLRSEIVES